MRGSTLAHATTVRRFASSGRDDVVARVGVARHHVGDARSRRREAGRVVPQHRGVATVGAADEQHDVGPRGGERGDACAVELAAGHVHDLGTGREPDARTGLGRDDPLVAHDREPQAAPGRRAHPHLGGLPAGLRHNGSHGGVEPGQHVLAVTDGRGHGRGREQAARLGAADDDRGGLGERGAGVRADDVRPAHPRACTRSATRSSTCSMPTDSRTRSAGTSSVGAGDGRVRHAAGVLDERLDAAERLAQGEQPRAVADLERRALAAVRRGS